MSSDERPAPPADPTPAEPASGSRSPSAPANPAEPASAPGSPVGPASALGGPAEPASAPASPAEPASAPASPAEPASAPGSPAEPAPLPDEVTLEGIATPAELRRAPRIGAFISTGVVVGVVVGWLLAVLGSGTSGEARTGAILLTAAGLGALGGIVGSGLAALADRRSIRSRRARTGG